MAFPTVQGLALTTTGLTNPVTVNLPSGIQAGDGLIMFVTAGAAIPSVPSGWTLVRRVQGAGIETVCYFRIATGSEGSTVTWTNSVFSSRFLAVVYRVSNVRSVGEIYFSGGYTTATPSVPATVMPPAVSIPQTFAWANRDVLQITSGAIGHGNGSISSRSYGMPAGGSIISAASAERTTPDFTGQHQTSMGVGGMAYNSVNRTVTGTIFHNFSFPDNPNQPHTAITIVLNSTDGYVFPVSSSVLGRAVKGAKVFLKRGVASAVTATATLEGDARVGIKWPVESELVAAATATANIVREVPVEGHVAASATDAAAITAAYHMAGSGEARAELLATPIAIALPVLQLQAQATAQCAFRPKKGVAASVDGAAQAAAAAVRKASVTAVIEGNSVATAAMIAVAQPFLHVQARALTQGVANRASASGATVTARATFSANPRRGRTVSGNGFAWSISDGMWGVQRHAARLHVTARAETEGAIFGQLVSSSVKARATTQGGYPGGGFAVTRHVIARAIPQAHAGVVHQLSGEAAARAESTFEAENYRRVFASVAAIATSEGEAVRRVIASAESTATAEMLGSAFAFSPASATITAKAIPQLDAVRRVTTASAVSAFAQTQAVAQKLVVPSGTVTARAAFTAIVVVAQRRPFSATAVARAVASSNATLEMAMRGSAGAQARVRAILRGTLGVPAPNHRRRFVAAEPRKLIV